MNKKLLILALLQSISCFGIENSTSGLVVSDFPDMAQQGPIVIIQQEVRIDLEREISDALNKKTVSEIKSVAKIAGYTAVGSGALMAAIIAIGASAATLSYSNDVLLLGIMGTSFLGSCFLLHECVSKGLLTYKKMKNSKVKKVSGYTVSVVAALVSCKAGLLLGSFFPY